MEGLRDAEAHTDVLTEVTAAVVDHSMAASAVLELLNEDGTQLSVDLDLHTHAAEHRNDARLCCLRLLLLRGHEHFEGRGRCAAGSCKGIEFLGGRRHLWLGFSGHHWRLSSRDLMDEKAHFGLEADAKTFHIRTIV